MTAELLPIGLFARLCRLSVKQLRHYDEIGLLPPAQVDVTTGYRYYSRDQVRDAMAIALLRTLDVPLPAIAETLAGDEAIRNSVLRTQRERLEAQIAGQRRTLQVLDRLLTEGLLRQEVDLSREPARRLLVTQAVCTADEIGATTARCIEDLMALMSGISWTPPLWGLFPVDLQAHVRITVGIESAASTPGTTVEHLPAGLAAIATHVGPYEHLALTYHAVFAWIHERGLRPHGVVREAYLTSPTTSEPAHLATRVIVPIDDEEHH